MRALQHYGFGRRSSPVILAEAIEHAQTVDARDKPGRDSEIKIQRALGDEHEADHED